MKLMNRLESSLGHFAVPRITIYIVVLQVLAFAIVFAESARNPEHGGDYFSRLTLDGSLVRHGEVWRILTFVALPPLSNPICFGFAMYLLFLMGTALENHWGTFRYNLFLIVGWVATVAAALALPSGPATNAYLMESIFLAFAYLFPEFQLLLFFVLPVRVKWLALIVWILYLVQFILGGWLDKCLILAATANFLLFFISNSGKGPRAAIAGWWLVPNRLPVRLCLQSFTTCGVTEKSDPRMEFRYCPQCSGPVLLHRAHSQARAPRNCPSGQGVISRHPRLHLVSRMGR